MCRYILECYEMLYLVFLQHLLFLQCLHSIDLSRICLLNKPDLCNRVMVEGIIGKKMREESSVQTLPLRMRLSQSLSQFWSYPTPISSSGDEETWTPSFPVAATGVACVPQASKCQLEADVLVRRVYNKSSCQLHASLFPFTDVVDLVFRSIAESTATL